MAVGLNFLTRESVDLALREFDRLGRDAFIEKYKFGKALEYLVKDPLSGKWADSKAIVGVAYGFRFPDRGPLRASEFSGGQIQVVRLLRELGFTVESAADIDISEKADDRTWSRAEVELVVADYLDMLALELANQSYNKAERRRALMPLLNDRSHASIEFKRRNISSVMLEIGMPAIRGYLPAANRQAILVDVVEQQVASNLRLEDLARSFTDTPALPLERIEFSKARVASPARQERQMREPSSGGFRAFKRDYLEREARNRSLGTAGELFILRYEQWRLSAAGVGQLAEKVRHVSIEDGDGLGYDVLSFQVDGSPKYVEVKTTALGELTPFFVSATEARFAREESSRYSLCRLFDFRAAPRFFELPGSIESHCALDPTTYRATLY